MRVSDAPGYLAAVRILLWHGYLLTGSGSNVYTANIAREWRRAGHDVVVMCQDRRAGELSFVDESFDLDGPVGPLVRGEGSCRVVRPLIGSLLPVYVYDEYEGFLVKRFVDLTEAELDRYTELNVEGMAQVIDSFRPEAIITGHEVMGPYIARRARERFGASYIAKLHGSALEYAVKVQDRYRALASDGLAGAARVVGGSAYMVREAAAVVPGWKDRAVVVNPGCDVELFRPSVRPREGPPVVAFVGKLIPSKGVHHLLGALGLLEHRDLKVVVVGYGGFERELRELAGGLKRREIDVVRRLAERNGLQELERFIEGDGITDRYLDRVAAMEIEFTGRLEHGPLAALLPDVDVLVVPSVVPEAFGMVAAEAAACGVLPVVPDHSGIGEAGAAVEEAIGRPGFLTFDATDPIRALAAAIDRVLATPLRDRDDMSRAAAALARARWSWTHVAERLLEHARGTGVAGGG